MNAAQIEHARTWSGPPDERYFAILASLADDSDAGTATEGALASTGVQTSMVALEGVTAEAATFNRTDAGNGEFFARLYGGQVRYDHRRRRWRLWAGHWWRDDDREAVRRLAKHAARERYGAAPTIEDLGQRTREASFAIASENRGRIDAMLIAAQAEPPIADPGDGWDADPWLLGVANGVIDLRTGRLGPGAPTERITLHSTVAFDPAATCPRWERFLDEIFRGDRELIDYLARAIGYSLTGDVREQCVFWCWGTGANGKSVLLTILRELAGDYAANAPFSTFEQRDRASIPNDLAALASRRVVTAAEAREGVRLNEARLKALSGGDPITARFLYGELFTFQPVGKIWLAFNRKPTVTDDSHGFWRRVRLIPFTRQFDADRDEDLTNKLRLELPGILAWAVRGCLAWQEDGLVPPAAVTVATEMYRAESDPIAAFLDERCLIAEGATVAAASAYHAYRTWAGDQGLAKVETLSNTAFGTRLGVRFTKKKANRGNVYVGLGLLSEPGFAS